MELVYVPINYISMLWLFSFSAIWFLFTFTLKDAAKGQWGGGMDLQGSIRQANSLRMVGALFATRTGTLWPNGRNGTVRNVAKEDTRSAIAHIHEVEEGYFRSRRSIVLYMRRRLWYQLNGTVNPSL